MHCADQVGRSGDPELVASRRAIVAQALIPAQRFLVVSLRQVRVPYKEDA